MPSRLAVSRSITRPASSAWFCRSVFTSRSPGNGLHALQNSRRPIEQILKVVSLQGVLKLCVARAAADLHILDRLQEKRASGHARQARPQPVDHLIRADLALLERL